MTLADRPAACRRPQKPRRGSPGAPRSSEGQEPEIKENEKSQHQRPEPGGCQGSRGKSERHRRSRVGGAPCPRKAHFREQRPQPPCSRLALDGAAGHPCGPLPRSPSPYPACREIFVDYNLETAQSPFTLPQEPSGPGGRRLGSRLAACWSCGGTTTGVLPSELSLKINRSAWVA